MKLLGKLLGVGEQKGGLGVIKQPPGALRAEFRALLVGTRLQPLNADSPSCAALANLAGHKGGTLLESAPAAKAGKCHAQSLSLRQSCGVVAHASGVSAQHTAHRTHARRAYMVVGFKKTVGCLTGSLAAIAGQPLRDCWACSQD